jgi:hypothetical protein
MNGYANDESSRRRWALIAGAALAAVALLAVAFAVGRASAPSVGAGGTRVVNVQSGPGPTRVVNGVPVGYAHTQAGAVAAATNYLVTFSGSLVTQPDKYRAAVDQMAALDARGKLMSLANNNLIGQQNLITYAAQGRTVVDRVVPLAYKLTNYSDSGAQVSIWGETLTAVDGALALREGWATTTVSVEWTDGDWRLANIPAGPGPDASYGPVPTPIQAPNLSVTMPSQIADYRSYHAAAT